MKNKPIFLALEPVNFEDQLQRHLEDKFEYAEYSPSFFEFNRVEVIYLRFSLTIDRLFLEKFPGCRFVLCNATGIEHIDESVCSELGIHVISLRGETKFLETITATAELTWFLVLALARRAVDATLSVRRGSWNRNAFIGMQLRGRTLGITGLGRNGKKLAQYAKAFEMNILAYDPYVECYPGIEMCDSLVALCSNSDFVCITAVSDKNTRHIFNAEILSKIRSHAFLINSARGEIVDEDFVLSLLEAGKIGGYGTDVVTDERHYQKNILVRAASRYDNLLITPHIGGVTSDSWRETEKFVIERMLQIRQNFGK